MNALQKIGLTSSEEKVYLALLEKGDSTRTTIVKTSGIAGSKVYEVLDKLQKKGLVSTYKNNRVKHFKPTNPKHIHTYLEEKKEEIDSAEKEVEKIMPSLLSQFLSSREEQEVELLTGIKGLEVLFREQVEVLKKGDVCYVIGGTRGSDEEAVQAFFRKIHIMRQKKGIRTRMLFNNTQRKTTEHLYSKKEFPRTETKYINHASPVAINIYKDRTAILIFGKKTSAIHITSQDVANSFLEYFNLLWKTAR